MKINIYYGGRGLLDDPTLYVLNKMEEVLKELRVTVENYSGDDSGMAWNWRIHAAVFGCVLALWRQGKD